MAKSFDASTFIFRPEEAKSDPRLDTGYVIRKLSVGSIDTIRVRHRGEDEWSYLQLGAVRQRSVSDQARTGATMNRIDVRVDLIPPFPRAPGLPFIYGSAVRARFLPIVGLTGEDRFLPREDSFLPWEDDFLTPEDSFPAWEDSFLAPGDSFLPWEDGFLAWEDRFLAREDSFLPWEDGFLAWEDSFLTPEDSFSSSER